MPNEKPEEKCNELESWTELLYNGVIGPDGEVNNDYFGKKLEFDIKLGEAIQRAKKILCPKK